MLPIPCAAAGVLSDKLAVAWARTDAIFSMVSAEYLLVQPIPWRHPFLFYIGHLPAFAWNQLNGSLLKRNSFNLYFDNLFCRGIDPDIDTGECHWYPGVPAAWPELTEVLEYRDQVRETILDYLNGGSKLRANLVLAFNMILEHEYMHQETLLYMLQELPPEKKIRPPLPADDRRGAGAVAGVDIPAGPARMGARSDEFPFGWDNEFGEIVVDVPRFTIDSLPVTNAQYFEFVQTGAYNDERHWQPQDWQWKQAAAMEYPRGWTREGKEWRYRGVFDWVPFEEAASWPVYATLAEARAYAHWKGKRLPSEPEFHRAAYSMPDGRVRRYPWGDDYPDPDHANIGFFRWAPLPVGSSPAGASAWGVAELVGNGWEWTDTAFAPFPGFVPMANYPDYSRDFFDGKHFVLKGASWATAAELIRPSFRNWYQAHYPYIFAKFRCVKSSGG